MKFRVYNPEHSKAIQKRLFELGYKWGIKIEQEFWKPNVPFLFTDSHFKNTITWGDNGKDFETSENVETTLDDLYNSNFDLDKTAPYAVEITIDEKDGDEVVGRSVTKRDINVSESCISEIEEKLVNILNQYK